MEWNRASTHLFGCLTNLIREENRNNNYSFIDFPIWRIKKITVLNGKRGTCYPFIAYIATLPNAPLTNIRKYCLWDLSLGFAMDFIMGVDAFFNKPYLIFKRSIWLNLFTLLNRIATIVMYLVRVLLLLYIIYLLSAQLALKILV